MHAAVLTLALLLAPAWGFAQGTQPVYPGIQLATLSVWNSGTSVNATQNIVTAQSAPAVLVHLVQTTTITAGAITFEVSYDNSNWVTIPADAVLDPASTTFAQIALPYTLQASTNKPFLLIHKGWQSLRIKLSTAITGTGSVTPNTALLANVPAASTIALSPTAANFNVTSTVASLPNEGQQTAANSISVTPDTDNDAIGTTAAAVPGEAVYIAGTDGTNVTPIYVDPCQREARTVYRVDIVTATTTEIAAATASEFYYVCSINLVSAGANNVIIVEDDTATNCPSPTAGVSSGGTTAAEGWNFAANSGIVVGVGSHWIMKTGTANRSFCIITSAATQLSGTITYVSAP